MLSWPCLLENLLVTKFNWFHSQKGNLQLPRRCLGHCWEEKAVGGWPQLRRTLGGGHSGLWSVAGKQAVVQPLFFWRCPLKHNENIWEEDTLSHQMDFLVQNFLHEVQKAFSVFPGGWFLNSTCLLLQLFPSCPLPGVWDSESSPNSHTGCSSSDIGKWKENTFQATMMKQPSVVLRIL